MGALLVAVVASGDGGWGERDEGALTASTPGTYEFVCAVAGHAEAGMTGTPIVEEAD